MAEPEFEAQTGMELQDIDAFHADATAALRLYFNPDESGFKVRFSFLALEQVSTQLQMRLSELDLQSCLALLACIEARFQMDFRGRCRDRLKDELSRHFRGIAKKRKRQGARISLEEDIFEAWRLHSSDLISFIGDLRSAFKFRHWLAHGRYWVPKLGRKYDYETLFLMAEAVFSSFPFTY